MKKVELTSEWLQNWRPKRKDEEIADRGCKGLVVRGQPGGIKAFYRFENVRDPATGRPKRKRVRLGSWPALPHNEARRMVNDAKETKAAATGSVALTVTQIAEAYRRDVLSHRERSDEAWNVIRLHVVEAQPDAKRRPFGEWPARAVRPADVSALVRHAAQVRTVEREDGKRRVGGRVTARHVLGEVKAIFATAVGAGALETSPAALIQASALGLRKTSRARSLDAEEIGALFEAIDLNALLDGTAKDRKLSETVRLALALLLYVPVRSHSLIGARWEEVDLKGGTWTVPVARLKMRKAARATAKPLTVPLPSTVVAILKKLKAAAGDSPWVLASPRDVEDEDRDPVHIGEKAIVRALARLQASGRLAFGAPFVVHDLRRSWRSWAGNLGVDFETAERSLGHVLPGVASVYARGDHLERRTAAADLVAAALDRIRLGKDAKVTPLAAARASRAKN